MPTPGKRWRFVTIGTHNAWKPGDPRGWRSRNHKQHSSGDYRNPPRPEEHAGLRRWVSEHSGKRVIIPKRLRGVIGAHIVAAMRELDHCILGISVSGMHCHTLIELPDNPRMIKAIIGEAKRVSLRAVKSSMPGKVWAAGGDFDPVDSKTHAAAALNYILTKQGPGAWTWSFQEPVPHVHMKVKVRNPAMKKVVRTRGGAGSR